MRIEERSNPLAGSLALHLHLQQRSQQLRSHAPADLSRQCRVWLNEAQREIDRLNRGQDTFRPQVAHEPQAARETPAPVAAESQPVARDSEPKLYAVTPLGHWEAEPREAPRVVPPQVRIVPPHVTNVGSVLDVLA